jgi:hypothetical protein
MNGFGTFSRSGNDVEFMNGEEEILGILLPMFLLVLWAWKLEHDPRRHAGAIMGTPLPFDTNWTSVHHCCQQNCKTKAVRFSANITTHTQPTS